VSKSKIDFEAEGLLEGLEGDEREARIDLLEQLTEADVPLEDLKKAAEEDRLAMLPVEQVLGGDAKYTRKEVAEKSKLPEEFLIKQWQALGLPIPPADEPYFSDDDVEAAELLRNLREAGLDDEGIIEVARVIGEGMLRVADASASLVGRTFLREANTERDLGLRYAEAAREMTPVLAKQLQFVLGLHLREQVRRDVVGRAAIASGELPGSEEVSVAFADLVDFTKLGERLPPEELGSVAGKLASMATEIAEPPVRLVKTIGDAAMLVSPEPDPLVVATLGLVTAADEAGEEFPPLRSGIASGQALERGGDWYGHPVNLASRITGVARPGSVLVTSDVKEALDEDAYRWRNIGKRRVKGVRGSVSLWRVRSGDA
jgi:adenylate cyclase